MTANLFPTFNPFSDSASVGSRCLTVNPDIDSYLVDGCLKKWGGEFQTVESPIEVDTPYPAQEKIVLGKYPLLDATAALEALKAAKEAYNNGRGEWPMASVSYRIDCVLKFVEHMKSVRDDVVRLLMWEICKPITDAYKEFDRTVEYILDTVKALKELDHDCSKFTEEQGILAQIRRAPLGTALVMGPFNYPLNETFTTLIPALIMGNTIVMKPPKLGVLLFKPLMEGFLKTFPKGVVNIIFGDGRTIVTPIVSSPDLDVLAFIGSSKVAHILKAQHPRLNRLRCVLGLDAKNPAIVTPSANIDLAVKECVAGALTFNGQRCTALKIIFVHKSIESQFVRKMAEAIDTLRVGMPYDSQVHITPLAEPGKVAWLNELVLDAVRKGAQIETNTTSFRTIFGPTLLSGVTKEMRVYHEEQFGPVVPVVSYEYQDEVIEYMTQSQYGQQVSIFTESFVTLKELVDALFNQQCRININSQCQRGPDSFPFTGRKNSAEGTLSVTDALRVFSIRSVVAFKATDNNKSMVQNILRSGASKVLSTDYLM